MKKKAYWVLLLFVVALILAYILLSLKVTQETSDNFLLSGGSSLEGKYNALILEEVPFKGDEKITVQNLGALNSRQIIKETGFDKLFSGDITEKIKGQSMFACDLDEKEFGPGALLPCSYFKYFFDQFSFTKLARGVKHTLRVIDGKLIITSSDSNYGNGALVFLRYRLPAKLSFKDFITHYDRGKAEMCLGKYNTINIFAYGEDNPDPKYRVYHGDINSGHYFNENRERILYTGTWHQWSPYFGWKINQLLKEHKAEIYQLGIITDGASGRGKTCENKDAHLAFYIHGSDYFYLIKTTILGDAISASDMDGVSSFFVDIQE